MDAIFVLLNNPQTTFSPDESMATGIANGEIRSEPTHIIRDSFALVGAEKAVVKIADYGFRYIEELQFFKKLTGEGVEAEEAASRAKNITNLTEGQQNNLNRFNSKFSKNSSETKIYDLPQDAKAFQKEVPAKNIPNSKAVYEKQVSPNGETLNYTKTTYDGNGNIVHVKDKINNSKYE